MDIKNRLKIGGHEYTVEFTEAENMDDSCGETDRHKNRIRICETDPRSQQEETVLHEILHALNSGLKEEVIDGLAVGLYQVLKDNDMLK